MKHPLLTGFLAAAAMVMMASPTVGSPIIVFGDEDRDSCEPAPLVWIDPFSPLVYACEASESHRAVVVSSRGLFRIGGGIRAGVAGGLTAAPPALPTVSGSVMPTPRIAIAIVPPFADSPVRESPNVDVSSLPAFDVSSLPDLAPRHVGSRERGARVLNDIQDLNATAAAVVPEPGSIFLVGTGLALAARRLRRRT